MTEAFVYCWTDFGTNKLYVGVHKGTPDDGYVCSGKLMLEEYRKRPENFSREIVAQGTYVDMYALETAILKSAKADKNPGFYNQHTNSGKFYLKGHTKETRNKISLTKGGVKRPAFSDTWLRNISLAKIGNQNALGFTHTLSFKEQKRNELKGNQYARGSKRTIEEKMLISKRMLGKKEPTITCPHCYKVGGRGSMTRWHFDNCKKKVS